MPPIPARLAASMAFVALVAGVAALLGLPARATDGARTSADEPQYLLTATSLAQDGDLDIADEVATAAYLDYHEVPIDRQSATRPDGRRISPHDPLLPLLLALPVALGGWAAAKAMLAITAAATAALTLWAAVRRLEVSVTAATVVTASAFAGIPLAAYGGQIYPEMPAALALTAAATATSSGALTQRRGPLVVALVAIIALPWLAVKYVPVAAAVGVALLVRLRDRPRQSLVVVSVAVIAAATYLLAHRSLYGGLTVYASGDHFAESGEFSVVGTDADPIGRARRLSGLLVDGVFGIGVWTPLWLLLPLALGSVFGGGTDRAEAADRPGSVRSAERLALALLAVTWLTATFVALTMHGWWVPGRQLVVGLPMAVLVLARWVDGSVGRLRIAGALGLVGASNWAWLAIEASTGRRTLIVDFAETAAPGFRALSPLFPDGMRGGAGDAVLLGAWTIILAGLALAARQHGRRERRARSGARRSPSVMVRR